MENNVVPPFGENAYMNMTSQEINDYIKIQIYLKNPAPVKNSKEFKKNLETIK